MPDLSALSRQLQQLVGQLPTDAATEAWAVYQRQVAGALVTLQTHPAIENAWRIVLNDLIRQHVLATVIVGPHMQDAALVQEGKRQVILKLLLECQAALEQL